MADQFDSEQITRLALALGEIMPAGEAVEIAFAVAAEWNRRHPILTPSADLPACRDEDPAWSASLAACYDPPDYQHPEEPDDGI